MDRGKLISAVYSTALSPDQYEETLKTLDQLLFGDMEGLQDDELVFVTDFSDEKTLEMKHTIDPDFLNHFRQAHDIQLRIGREKNEKHKLLMLLDAASNPAYIFNSDENILFMNEPAKGVGDGSAMVLGDCCEDPDILKIVRQFIRDAGDQKLLIVPGYIDIQNNSNTCVLVRKIDNYSDEDFEDIDQSSDGLYFFTIVNLGFDQSKTKLFQKTYGLTQAEVSIAGLLANGKQVPEIALERSTSVATIRTQIKMIKQKTNSRDIPAMVRLLCGFSAGILISSQLSSEELPTPGNSGTINAPRQMTLRDGRRMGYLEQGDPQGKPVIMIHNMPYGVELPANAINSASHLKLRILAPFRPGIGNSDPLKNTDSDQFLSEVAADICELMDELNIPKATIVGQSVIGAVYATRFAHLYPNRVQSLMAVSGAPIWRDKWIARLPERQRFTVRIAKYLPQLLPLVTRATVMFLDKGYGKALVRGLLKDCPADTLAVKNPETMDLMVKGCKDGLRQGSEAFCGDCILVIRDISAEAQALPHKFHILHGDADNIVGIFQSEAFTDFAPGTELEIVKGAGHMLIYSHWDSVINAIKNKQN